MATKKEKRARGLQKREAFMAEQKETGLAAQRKAREAHEERMNRFAEEARSENRRLSALLAVLELRNALSRS